MIPIRDTVPGRRTPVITWLLIFVNSAVFLYELTLPPAALNSLVRTFGIVPATIFGHGAAFHTYNLYPLFTSMFLHAGWGHLLGNMWILWIFGDNVEDRMGPGRFLVFYILTGLIAALAHTLLSASSTIPTVGASGAIAGVLGAYFVLYPRATVIVLVPVFFWPLFFELPALVYLFAWFLFQLIGGAATAATNVGGVAWWAHIGGFGAGVVLHKLFILPRSKGPRPMERDEYGMESAWTREARR